MNTDVLQSYQRLRQQVPADEQAALDIAIQLLLDSWSFQASHVRRTGGKCTLGFQPGFGVVEVGWSPVSIKPNKR